MKCLGWVVAIVLSLSCSTGHAAVTVKSGEHEEFSRLVFYFDKKTSWNLGVVSGGYGLATSNDELQYDLSQVFEFIPRARISSLQEGSDFLKIVTSCECYIEAFEVSQGILVIDVIDGSALVSSPYQRPLAVEPVFFPIVSTAAPFSSSASDSYFRSGGSSGLDFREDLARGVFFGSLKMVEKFSKTAGEVVNERSQVIVSSGSEFLASSGDSLAGDDCHKNTLNFGNARGEVVIESLYGNRKLESNILEGMAYDHHIIRRNLQLLLYLGFGAEARFIMSRNGYSSPGDVLWDVSFQLDNPGIFRSESLAVLVSCSGPAVLWGVLGLGSAGKLDGRLSNISGIYHAVSRLPLYLRTHIGSAVSSQLIKLGYDEEATAVRSTVSRASRKTTVPMTPTDSINGSTPAELLEVTRMSRSRTTSALEAHFYLLELIVASAHELTPMQRSEIEAQIILAKGFVGARHLLSSYVDALILFEQHRDALTFLKSFSESKFEDGLEVSFVYNRVLVDLVQHSSNAKFLDLVSNFFPSDSILMDRNSVRAIASRLATLGYHGLEKSYRSSYGKRRGPHEIPLLYNELIEGMDRGSFLDSNSPRVSLQDGLESGFNDSENGEDSESFVALLEYLDHRESRAALSAGGGERFWGLYG